MRIFGYVKEVVQLWFRKDSNDVKLTPNANTYTGITTFSLPPRVSGSEDLVGTSATQTLTNKSLTAPSITAPTGLVKGDVGLGSVDNTSDATKNAAAVTLTNKSLDDSTTQVTDTSDPSVKLKFDVTGNAGTTTTLFTSQTANRNIVLPDAAGTIGLVPASGVVKSSGAILSSSNVNLASEVTGTLPNGNTTATNNNTASAIVARDGFGNFSAGNITANLTGDVTGNASGTAANVTGVVALANGGTGTAAGSAAAAFDALSPLTTKGDLVARNATVNTRIPVGVDGQVLLADSAQSMGLKWGDITGGGSGEINLVSNPSAASGTTSWNAYTAHTVTRVTSGSPLHSVISTAFRAEASAATSEGSPSGVWFSLPVPTGLANTKLKISAYITTPTTDSWNISVLNGATRLPLSTDSGGTTILPKGFTGKFQAAFDTAGAASYTLTITKTTHTASTEYLYFTSVVVGPGIQPQGAVVGPLTYGQTLTLNNMPATAVNNWSYQRAGECLQLVGEIQFSADGVSGSEVSFTLPSGLTTTTTRFALGTGEYFTTGDGRSAPLEGEGVSGDLGKIRLFSTGFTAGIIGTETGTSSGRMTNLYINALIPINEWAGSGTVNLAQNDVEYASNSSATDASDTTSFAYGPSGSVGVIGVTTLTATRTKRVRFLTPIQATDSIVVEFQDNANGGWVPVSAFRYGMIYTEQNTGSYGSGIQQVNSTDVDVKFGQYAYANGATFGAAGVNWSGAVGTLSLKAWRVKKISGGNAVGFGAATATSSGLVNTTDQTFAGVKTFNDGIKPSSGSSTLTTLETGGSWTPALDFVGGNGTASVSVALGRYIRINNMIMFSGMLSFAKGTASGTFRISGLPSNSSGVTYTGIAIHADTGVTLSSPRVCVQAYIASGGARIFPTFAMNNGTGAPGVDASDLAAGGSSFFFSGVYSVS
jgi:hypothetical protein